MKTKEAIDIKEKVLEVAIKGRPLTPKTRMKLKQEGIRLKALEEK